MALFSKNWKQWIVSKGEPFLIETLDRAYRGTNKVSFKIADGTGTFPMGTVEVGSGGLGVVIGNAKTGKVTIQGTLVHPVNQLFTTALGNNGAGAVTLAGTKKGDKVVGVVNITDHTSATAAFESTITVAGQIQQSSATDLSAKTLVFLIQKQS